MPNWKLQGIMCLQTFIIPRNVVVRALDFTHRRLFANGRRKLHTVIRVAHGIHKGQLDLYQHVVAEVANINHVISRVTAPFLDAPIMSQTVL
jgi:hypothetical protein